MRSYQAARQSFSFFEVVAGCLIVVGLLAVIPAIAATSSRGPLALVGGIPGIGISAMGIFGLAYAQTARASVDTAEYAQQSLQLARDQLEISKQLLRHATASSPATYETTSEPPQNVSYDTDAPLAKSPIKPPLRPEPLANGLVKYGGQQIDHQDGTFLFNDKKYETLIDAKLAVDGFRLKQEATKLISK